MKAVYHEDFLQQTQGHGHPECPERLSAIMDYLDENEIHPEIIKPEPAELDDVLTVHSAEYLEYLKHFGRGMLDGDSSVFPHTYDMAMLSAGGGLAAAKNMLDHNEPSFAILRPPGHHATSVMGMGFCYINNIAVAANWLRKKLDIVAIVDIDVHHGNGTNDSFLDRDDVLFISTHQWGIYPGTGPYDEVGIGDGEGYTVNIPMKSRSGDSTFNEASKKLIQPILRQFQPDAILISLGGDAHYMDPLASLTLSSKGYLDIMNDISGIANEFCNNRYAVYLEGGYNINALAETVGGAMAQSQEQKPALKFTDIADQDVHGASYLEEIIAMQSKYWEL